MAYIATAARAWSTRSTSKESRPARLVRLSAGRRLLHRNDDYGWGGNGRRPNPDWRLEVETVCAGVNVAAGISAHLRAVKRERASSGDRVDSSAECSRI